MQSSRPKSLLALALAVSTLGMPAAGAASPGGFNSREFFGLPKSRPRRSKAERNREKFKGYASPIHARKKMRGVPGGKLLRMARKGRVGLSTLR